MSLTQPGFILVGNGDGLIIDLNWKQCMLTNAIALSLAKSFLFTPTPLKFLSPLVSSLPQFSLLFPLGWFGWVGILGSLKCYARGYLLPGEASWGCKSPHWHLVGVGVGVGGLPTMACFGSWGLSPCLTHCTIWSMIHHVITFWKSLCSLSSQVYQAIWRSWSHAPTAI